MYDYYYSLLVPEGEVAYSCTDNCDVLDYELPQYSYGGRVTE